MTVSRRLFVTAATALAVTGIPTMAGAASDDRSYRIPVSRTTPRPISSARRPRSGPPHGRSPGRAWSGPLSCTSA